MAVYVLVHGGGHGGWCWRKLAPLLAAEGHQVHTPTLTGFGERVHLLSDRVDLDLNITDVANVLSYEDLRDVILVGHSYAGVVIAGVADRMPDRVGQLVYLDANIPEDGEAITDIRPDLTAALRELSTHVNGVEVISRLSDESGGICGVTDPVDLAWMRERVAFTPWRCVSQPLHLKNVSLVKSIPTSNINTVERLRQLLPAQQVRNTQADRVWEIDTGHDVMITEPKALAEMLLQLAEL